MNSVSVWQDFVSNWPLVFFSSVWLFRSSLLLLKMNLGKFDVFRVSSAFFVTSRASWTWVAISVFDCLGELVFFPFAGGLLCHRGSGRLSSLSEDPCHCVVDSVFCAVGSELLSSVGMNPPLSPRVSGRLFIL